MKKIVFAFSMIAAMVMAACTPETLNEQLGIPEDAILLSSERFSGHGDKTSVDDLSVKWVDGDYVYLYDVDDNGDMFEVKVVGDNAYVNDADALTSIRNNAAYGYYGVTGTPTWNSSGTKLTDVAVPSVYTSRYEGGRQVIALPMVAYKSGAANKIEFKHVTAAVKVRVRNNTGAAVYLDSVVVNSTYQLSGTISEIDMSYMENLTIAANSTDVDADDKRVKVVFANETVTIANGGEDIKEVQVPILPVGLNANLTINVYTHGLVARTGMPSVNCDYIFSHTATVPVELSRNVMITAQVEIQKQTDADDNHITEVDHSLFTVNASGKKVRFSKGNLQYIGSATPAYWKFADNQYDYLGTTTGQNSAATNVDRDLFGWGTGNNPTNTSTTVSDYASFNDWGTAAASNIGGDWYTLIGDEWNYMIKTISATPGTNCRVVNSSNMPSPSATYSDAARYVKATVGSVPGLIVFPDNYTHPKGVSVTSTITSYNDSYGNYSKFVVTSGWDKMERAGAVFFPAAGERQGTTVSNVESFGNYYASDATGNAGYHCYFKDGAMNSKTSTYPTSNKSYGYSVRLVKDAN